LVFAEDHGRASNGDVQLSEIAKVLDSYVRDSNFWASAAAKIVFSSITTPPLARTTNFSDQSRTSISTNNK